MPKFDYCDDANECPMCQRSVSVAPNPIAIFLALLVIWAAYGCLKFYERTNPMIQEYRGARHAVR